MLRNIWLLPNAGNSRARAQVRDGRRLGALLTICGFRPFHASFQVAGAPEQKLARGRNFLKSRAALQATARLAVPPFRKQRPCLLCWASDKPRRKHCSLFSSSCLPNHLAGLAVLAASGRWRKFPAYPKTKLLHEANEKSRDAPMPADWAPAPVTSSHLQ